MDLLHKRLKINSKQNASGVEEQHRVDDDLKTVEVPVSTVMHKILNIAHLNHIG
jgi:hypothetical protein